MLADEGERFDERGHVAALYIVPGDGGACQEQTNKILGGTGGPPRLRPGRRAGPSYSARSRPEDGSEYPEHVDQAFRLRTRLQSQRE